MIPIPTDAAPQSGIEPEIVHLDYNTGQSGGNRIPKQGTSSERGIRAFHTGYHRSGHNGHSPVDHILLDHPAGCVCQGGKPETIGRNDKTECRIAGYAQEYHPHLVARYPSPFEHHQRQHRIGDGHTGEETAEHLSEQYRNRLPPCGTPSQQPAGRVPPERGERDTQRCPVQPSWIAGTYRFGILARVNNKGILFDSDFKNTEVRLYGDADRIEQIIDNLLANAVKFTESGTISFHVRYHDGNLILEIKDTGIGMSEETLSRIFRPFERQTSAANADGYGLGLSITQGLVNLLDGTIEVTSSIDRGSTFRVTLPVPETNEPVESENPILPHFEYLPHSVLVIDDDSMLRDVIKEMLERNGITCTVCSSAREVVKAMRCMDYDLLLSDIQMPGTNGFSLLALLRNSNIGNSRTIPVVAMTARGDKDKKAYLEAGFADCIYKPFFSPELLSLLSTVKRCREDENRGIDFSTMLAEVNDKVKLLCSFIEQSRQDAEELASAMNNADRKKLRETVHRMQPMWELLQMEETLSAYRVLLKDKIAGDDAVREHTHQIIECTAMLIAEAENEIKKLTNETENIDS